MLTHSRQVLCAKRQLGPRSHHRFIATQSKDTAPAFFGQDTPLPSSSVRRRDHQRGSVTGTATARERS